MKKISNLDIIKNEDNIPKEIKKKEFINSKKKKKEININDKEIKKMQKIFQTNFEKIDVSIFNK
ncbi:hypothetical protein RJT62_02005 [Buchnera aphidicola (Mindarus keteleerifoliae)]|uniref:hypothetical protein n=1 Tax=Buchnera aphidicola TaxID=9 RepID=UPI0031B6C77F